MKGQEVTAPLKANGQDVYDCASMEPVNKCIGHCSIETRHEGYNKDDSICCSVELPQTLSNLGENIETDGVIEDSAKSDSVEKSENVVVCENMTLGGAVEKSLKSDRAEVSEATDCVRDRSDDNDIVVGNVLEVGSKSYSSVACQSEVSIDVLPGSVPDLDEYKLVESTIKENGGIGNENLSTGSVCGDRLSDYYVTVDSMLCLQEAEKVSCPYVGLEPSQVSSLNVNAPVFVPRYISCSSDNRNVLDLYQNIECPQSLGQCLQPEKDIGVSAETCSVENDVPSVLSCITNSVRCSIVGGGRYDCLIDSGASISLIAGSVFDRTPSLRRQSLQPSYTIAKSANGTDIALRGTVDVDIDIQGHIFTHPVYVADSLSPTDLVLGLDFLQRHKVLLDFDQNTMSAPGLEPVNLGDRSGIKGTCRLVSAKTIVLKPNTQTYVTADVQGGNVHDGLEGLIVPNPNLCHSHRVAGAKVLGKVQDGKMVCLIFNPNDTPVKIYRRSTLGHLCPHLIEVVNVVHDPTATKPETEATALRTGPPAVDLTDSDLSHDQKDRLMAFLTEYRQVFANTDAEIGRTSVSKMSINTGDHPPIKQRPYRVGPVQKDIIDAHVQRMLNQKVIVESDSPWSSPVVLVKKKGAPSGQSTDPDHYRFCIDFRKLNLATVKDAYPLPVISESIDEIGSSKATVFSSLDLRSSYHQVELNPTDGSTLRTAFQTPSGGLYHFETVPFGLTNAPSLFQRVMEKLMRGAHHSYCLIYIDDLLVFSSDFEQHLVHLGEVFDRLLAAGLTLKPSKCSFAKKEVHYLGFIIDRHGIRPDEGKVKIIKEFPAPRSVTEVKSFLGLANYYRRFVKGMAEIAAPLNRLTKKGVDFVWSDECQASFNAIKERLISEPILAYPRFDKPFIIQCDASAWACGAILCQEIDGKEQVVCYAGRKFNDAETRYSASERELLAVLFGVKTFKPYIYGRRFRLVTDHFALKWIMSLKDPTGRLGRWSLQLQDLDFEIVHKSGPANSNADAISRMPYIDEEPAQVVNAVSDNLLVNAVEAGLDMQAAQSTDPFCSKMIDYVQTETLPADAKLARSIALTADYYTIRNNLLYRLKVKKRNVSDELLLVVPESLRRPLMAEVHDSIVGHLGIAKTFEVLHQGHYWRGMYDDVREHVRSCVKCCRRKTPRHGTKAPLTPLPPAVRPFERLAVDCVGPLPKSRSGNKYLVVFSDYLTRWPEVYCTPSIEAPVIAKLLVDEIIPRHGAPECLLSDLGSNFTSALVSEVCRLGNIGRLRTSSYHPQTDGLVEKLNGTLIQMLSMYTNAKQTTWDEFVPAVLFAYRVSRQESVGYSPFHLLYGRHARLPLASDLLSPLEGYSGPKEHLDTVLGKFKVIHSESVDKLSKAQKAMKKRYDKKSKVIRYKLDQQVLLRVPRIKAGLSKKFLHPYRGPYVIREVIPPGSTFRLETLSGKPLPHTVHSDRLKPYIKRRTVVVDHEVDSDDDVDEQDVDKSHDADWVDETLGSDADDVYEVERILASRIRKGIKQYKVRWKGYGARHDSFEPEENILDKRVIATFEASKNLRGKGNRKRKHKRVTVITTLSKPTVVNIRGLNIEDWVKDEENLYVGRNLHVYTPGSDVKTNKWENPFSLLDYDRQTSLKLFEKHAREYLMQDLHELNGKQLGCWCHPLPCHADVLIRLFCEHFGNCT